jgi:hypothetical protein
MDFVDQSPAGLTFAHFTTPRAIATFNSSVLTVRKRQVETIAGLHVEAAIIGESHYVVIRGNGLHLVELLACIDIKRYGFYPTHSCQEVACEPKWSYQLGLWQVKAQLSFHESASPELRTVLGQSVLSEASIVLELQFPGSMSPRTLVGIRESSRALTICTIHEYTTGDEQSVDIVHSQTSLSPRR